MVLVATWEASTGAHYAMDVLAGRTLAAYDVAQLLAKRPGYVGVRRDGLQIDDFQTALEAARTDITEALEARCGHALIACAEEDQSRFADAAKNRAFYEATQTSDLPVVFEQNANSPEDVGKLG